MEPGSKRRPGERIGEYCVTRYLASGGMGDVYAAHLAADPSRTVALKVMTQTGAAATGRFAREARIAMRLSHPSIIEVYGHGETDDGVPFMAMELLEGEDLSQRIGRKKLSPAEAVWVARQVCGALSYAHGKLVVHRDLKPENIFLCGGSVARVKVLDFGIARALDERQLTRTGSVLGTPMYMSPEQARGQNDLDARADLWSLGVVLYESLVNALPFNAPSLPGVLFKILLEDPPDLAQRAPGTPAALTRVVHRLLEKPREKRYPDAGAVRDALPDLPLEPEPDEAPATAPPTGQHLSLRPTEGQPSDFDDPRTIESPFEAPDEELRPVSAVYLANVGDQWLVRQLAGELDGTYVPTRSDALVVFGAERWNSDEPFRAVRLASAAALACHSVGVATDKAATRGPAPIGRAIDRAVALASRPGVSIDANTAALVHATAGLRPLTGGGFELDARALASPSTPPPPRSDAPFSGRDLELNMLLDTARAAADSRTPAGMLVLGASGMGKSRLRIEASQSAGASFGYTVLHAQCETFRRASPYSALRGALEGHLDAALLRSLFDLLDDTTDAVSRRDRTHAGLEAVLTRMGRDQPVLLAIDDAQWLDAASAGAVSWLCRHALDLPLAVWLFSRPDGAAQLRDLVPGAMVRELGALSNDAARSIVRAIAGSGADPLVERTGGNPLFLVELARVAAAGRGDTESLPFSIEATIVAQMDALGVGEKGYVKRVAIFGRSAPANGVAALDGDPQALAPLRRAGMLSAGAGDPGRGPEVTLRSALLQEVAYGLWTETQRGALHERAAAWLAQNDAAAPDEIARHLELAGDLAGAAEQLVRATERCSQLGDVGTTCALVERALAIAEQPALRWRALVAQDAALQLGSDRAKQAAGLEEMERLLETPECDSKRAEYAWRRCYFARAIGDRAEAVRHGLKAITGVGVSQFDARWSAATRIEMAFLLADQGRSDEATHHAEAARTIALQLGDPWLTARACHAVGYTAIEAGDERAGLVAYEAAARGYAATGDRRREASAMSNLGYALLGRGSLVDALWRFEAAITLARQVGNANAEAIATHNRGTVHRLLGDVENARRDFATAAREAERLRHKLLAAAVATDEGYLALAGGATRDDEARALSERCLALALTAESPGALASAQAVALRLGGDRGVSTAHLRAEIEARVAAEELRPEALLEQLGALRPADPAKLDAWKGALRSALAACAPRGDAPDDDDRASRADALVRRYALGAHLSDALNGV